jgi:hypothetical protein
MRKHLPGEPPFACGKLNTAIFSMARGLIPSRVISSKIHKHQQIASRIGNSGVFPSLMDPYRLYQNRDLVLERGKKLQKNDCADPFKTRF